MGMRMSTGAILVLAISAVSSFADEQSQIDFANGLFARGFYGEAVVEYRAYLSEYPDGEHTMDALHRLGEAEAAAKNFPAALVVLNRLLGSEVPDDLRQRATLRRGVVLYELKRYREAQGELAPLTAKDGPPALRAEAQYYIGKSFFEASQPDEALRVFQALIRDSASSPLIPYVRYQVAFIHLSLEEYERAAVSFSEIAATTGAGDSLRMESRFRAAEAYDKIGWFDAAVKAYEQLRAEFPGTDYARRASYGYSWALYHAGKYDEAFVAGEAYLKENPGSARNAGVLYLQGNCLQEKNKHAEALEIYESLRARYSHSDFQARSRYKSAWSLHLMGESASAKIEIQGLLAEDSGSRLGGDARYLLGTILYDEGRFARALQEFSAVAEKHPESEFAGDALFRSADCLTQLDKAAEAAQIYDRFSRTYPENPLAVEAVFKAGNEDFRAGAYDEAAQRYERVLQMSPRSALEEDTLYRLATAQHNMEGFKSSAATFGILLKEYPDSSHSAEAHLRIGDYLLRDKAEALEAMASFERAYSSDPKGEFAGRALRGLSLARFETKDFDGAAEGFLRVITQHPDVKLNEQAYAWVGQHLFDREEWAQASEAFQALLSNVPEYPYADRVHLKIGEAMEREGKLEEALKRYRQVVTTDPRSLTASEAKFRMAKVHEEKGELEDAKRLYEEAANINTGDVAARARFRLAELHETAGDFDAAARNYMRVVILFLHEDLSPEAMWRAGQCFEKQSAPERAVKTYQELVDEYPGSTQAGKARTRLKELGP